MGLRDR